MPDCLDCWDGEDLKNGIQCPTCGRKGGTKTQLTKERSAPSFSNYREARKSLRGWIERREHSLWQRRDYQRDLNKLVNMFPNRVIPKEGFPTWDEANNFVTWLFENKLWDIFQYQLREIVKKYASKRLSNRSSRFQLGDEWIWAVMNHLFGRERGREVARYMVEDMSLPQVETVYDKWTGEEIDAELRIIKDKTPEPIIREAKKYLKSVKRKIQATGD